MDTLYQTLLNSHYMTFGLHLEQLATMTPLEKS